MKDTLVVSLGTFLILTHCFLFYFHLANVRLFASVAILGVHTLVTSTQSYDGTSSKDGYNSAYSVFKHYK